MPRITILSDTLASQVAAGEVVERPASVLKELVENALDAGATRIDVEARRGGTALLKVTDNGHGMSKEDALLSLERHATSKIRSASDLASITSHGFRGEALPSIFSVARVRMVTSDQSALPATEILSEGGTLREVKPTAHPVGTSIEVRDLFFNVPARKKFLKAEATEYAHLEQVLRLSALANPQTRFLFRSNGRLVWDLKPSRDARVRIGEFLSPDKKAELITLSSYQHGQSAVQGYLLPARLARGSGRSQSVFINGRPVDDPVIRKAVRHGYKEALSPGQYPIVWLWMTMPPDEVDVNVHPAKREVRFTRPTEIQHLLSCAIESALQKPRSPLPSSPGAAQAPATYEGSAEHPPPSPPSALLVEETAASYEASGHLAPSLPSLEKPSTWQTPQQELLPAESNETGASFFSETSALTVLGTLKNLYWIAQEEEGLVLIDPKRARARISYEALREAYQGGSVESQALLFPLLYELDGYDRQTLENHLPLFESLGIEISAFGGATYQVHSLPALLSLPEKTQVESFFYAVLDQLDATFRPSSEPKRFIEAFLKNVSQQASRFQSTHPRYAPGLLAELLRCHSPYCCPSGFPTIVHYSESELLKKFGA